MDIFKIAICQLKVIDNKKSNIKRAIEMIETSANNGSDLVILPEMFNCPYDNAKFIEYAEKKDESETLNAISNVAKTNNVIVIAGSIPEIDEDKIYNSCFIFNSEGHIIGNYRKIHLFDIDTPKIRFKESDTISAGDKIGVFDTKLGRIGIAICYDIRFAELIKLLAINDAKLVVIPGAFNMITGPAHWEILIRSRAIDNQIFVAASSPARNEELSYVAYGNSMIVGPWGDILARADEDEEIIYADIDMKIVDRVRNELPIIKNRRDDIYK